jgi:hypothetical protein
MVAIPAEPIGSRSPSRIQGVSGVHCEGPTGITEWNRERRIYEAT